MTNRIARLVTGIVLAAGLLGGAAVFAQDQTDKAPQGETPMVRNMPGGMGDMMGMMGMMSAMTEMMQTCNKIMQAALPDQKPPAEPGKDG